MISLLSAGRVDSSISQTAAKMTPVPFADAREMVD